MKRLILVSLLLGFCFMAAAQDIYFVSVVKGRVLKANGTKVVVGTKLTLNDKVVFSLKTDFLVLLHPNKGRLVVLPTTIAPNKDNTFTVMIKDFLQIKSETVRLSAKQGDTAKKKEFLEKAAADSARVAARKH